MRHFILKHNKLAVRHGKIHVNKQVAKVVEGAGLVLHVNPKMTINQARRRMAEGGSLIRKPIRSYIKFD